MFNVDNNIRTLSFDEQMLMKDNHVQKGENFIVIRDPETNCILQVRKNLVVRSGRETILRKVFNLPYAGEDKTKLDQRIVCSFGIGSGGTPVADPFNPIAPTPADSDMTAAVPFRTIANTDSLTPADAKKYFDKRTAGSDFKYYKKLFTNLEIVTDNVKDEYYIKATLDIAATDSRGALISELGLYSALNTGVDAYTNFKIFSRITFETESMTQSTGKALSIDYYVYA